VSAVRRFPSPRSPLPAPRAGTSYLLCGSPRPRANRALRAGGDPPPRSGTPAGLVAQARRRGSTPVADPRLRVNGSATGASPGYAGLHTGATPAGHTLKRPLSLPSERPTTRVCPPSPCTRPRRPAGPRPFNAAGGRLAGSPIFAAAPAPTLPKYPPMTGAVPACRLEADRSRTAAGAGCRPSDTPDRGRTRWSIPSLPAWATGRWCA